MPKPKVICLADELLHDGAVTTGAARIILEFGKVASRYCDITVVGSSFTGESVHAPARGIRFVFTEPTAAAQMTAIARYLGHAPSAKIITFTDRGIEIAAGAISKTNHQITIVHWQHYNAKRYRDSAIYRYKTSLRAVITPTEWEAKRISREIGRDIPILVVHNGVSPIRKSGTPRSTRRLTFIGRRSWDKGFDIWMRTARLLADMDPKLHFVNIGAAGKGEEDLSAVERGVLFLKDRLQEFEFIPQRAVWEIIEGSCMIVLPTRRDIFPICLLEAAQLARPAITSGIPNLQEVAKLLPNVQTVSGWSPQCYCESILAGLERREWMEPDAMRVSAKHMARRVLEILCPGEIIYDE